MGQTYFSWTWGGVRHIFHVPEGGSTLFYIYINRWNVAKQHTHFSIMLWSNISTFFYKMLARSLCWGVKLLSNKCWPLFFIGYRLMGKGREASRCLIELFLPLSLMCAKGGSTIFLNPERGGSSFFLSDSGGGQSFFSHFCDLPQWWNHISAAWSLII